MKGEFLRSHRELGTLTLPRSGAQFIPGKSDQPVWQSELIGYDGRYPLRHGFLAPIAYDEIVSVESADDGIICNFSNSEQGDFKTFARLDDHGLIHTACLCGGVSQSIDVQCCGHQIVAIQCLFVYTDMPGVEVPYERFEQMKEQHKEMLGQIKKAGEAPLMAAQSGYLIMKYSFERDDARYVIDSNFAIESWGHSTAPQLSDETPAPAPVADPTPDFDWESFSL